MINKQTIQTIFETARVEEVVGEFVNLKKRGVNHIGLCPFHNEKTPSFTVSPSKGIYKCFGCGKGGNSVNFIMDHEHYTYPEALKYLAKKYNIEIEEEEQTPEQIKQLNEQESLYSLNDFARDHFVEQLFETEEGKAIALSYLKDRDYREDIIRKFQVGYCDESWESFTKHALENGYSLEYLDKTGLTIVKDDKKFDRFRGRVMFPIHNLTGKVLGFGGRVLKSEQSKAKYVNSPESDIYNKSKSLYGIFFAKNSIVSKDNCYLVEGYTDVMSLHQAGIENVVASSGTSLTTDQIKLIRRYTPNITILFDGDEAGLKASFRGIDMILEEGMNVKIVMFPEGEDPDSYVRSHRTAEVHEYIEKNARDFISFKTSLLNKESQGDPIKKASLVKEIVQTISLIPDGIFRTFYVKQCSSIMKVPEQTLMNELNKLLRKRFKDKVRKQEREEIADEEAETLTEPQPEVEGINTESQERELIRILLNFGSAEIGFEQEDERKQMVEVPIKVALFIINDILNDELKFNNPLYQKVFDDYVAEVNQNRIPPDRHFINHDEQELATLAIDLLTSRYQLSNNWESKRIFVPTEVDRLKDYVVSTLLNFKAKSVDRMIMDNQKELESAEQEEDILIFMKKDMELKDIRNKIAKDYLSRTIYK
ncbi:MAG: DNA primase [Bacteroidales bacterium]|nr:DNA primase [Bacteroidales bacterium]MCF8343626.1 DNA primase [Bacteroidales bacterium]MCF8350112.1 DNA primase [Bacteroidales bacterium]MCF8376170.1 DNA primase [Bacteroidales bacterium]MCF8402260.1 DNA primase [Bacteroidales bacterium]